MMAELLSGQLLVAALVLASVYGLVALGLNLIYGTMRLLNVAHGEILMLGGYFAYWTFTLTGVGPIYSMFVAMVLAGALGAAVYHYLCRHVLRASKLVEQVEANSLLVLFGVSIILQNVVALSFTATARAYPYLDQIIHIGTFQVTANRLVVLGIGLAVCLACVAFFRYSMTGLAIRALIQQADAYRPTRAAGSIGRRGAAGSAPEVCTDFRAPATSPEKLEVRCPTNTSRLARRWVSADAARAAEPPSVATAGDRSMSSTVTVPCRECAMKPFHLALGLGVAHPAVVQPDPLLHQIHTQAC